MNKATRKMALTLYWGGMASIIGIMFLVTADVVGRYVFRSPVRGALELSQFMLLAVVFLSAAYTALVRGHISIDIVVSRLSLRSQAILDAVNNLLVIAILGLIVWQGIEHAFLAREARETTDVLRIATFPARLLVPLGVLATCLVFVTQFLDSLSQIFRSRGK